MSDCLTSANPRSSGLSVEYSSVTFDTFVQLSKRLLHHTDSFLPSAVWLLWAHCREPRDGMTALHISTAAVERTEQTSSSPRLIALSSDVGGAERDWHHWHHTMWSKQCRATSSSLIFRFVRFTSHKHRQVEEKYDFHPASVQTLMESSDSYTSSQSEEGREREIGRECCRLQRPCQELQEDIKYLLIHQLH